MQLHYANEKYPQIHSAIFEEILKRLEYEISGNFELSPNVELLLCDDAEIRELNLKYRGKDKATDVLSFLLPDFPPDEACPLWQIVISFETAERQALELEQSIEEELGFLFAHGLAHLLGHDHETPEEEAEMLKIVYKILDRH